jgi:hypothetical protein
VISSRKVNSSTAGCHTPVWKKQNPVCAFAANIAFGCGFSAQEYSALDS